MSSSTADRTEGSSWSISADTLFGLSLTTFRRASAAFVGDEIDNYDPDKLRMIESVTFYQYECILAAVAIIFCRWTIRSYDTEPFLLRLSMALLLGILAYMRKPYEVICASQILSYVLPWILRTPFHKLLFLPFPLRRGSKKSKNGSEETGTALDRFLIRIVVIVVSALGALLVSHFILSDDFCRIIAWITPSFVQEWVYYLIPIVEMNKAYSLIAQFMNPGILRKLLSHLFFVTFNIQVGMGHLGIDFLKKEQQRRNTLIRMDVKGEGGSHGKSERDSRDGKSLQDSSKSEASDKVKEIPTSEESSRARKTAAALRFQRGAPRFILFTAVPYMLQIILFGNMNFFAYHCVMHDIHRQVRLNQVFSNDSRLVAMANDSPTSPDQYAASMDVIVETTYDFFNRKLFSLPKLLLLPGIIMRQPVMVAQITPLIFGSDFLKARILAFLTENIERLKKEAKEIMAIRTKIEAFDMKNAELLQRAGQASTEFTKRRWEELTVKLQDNNFMSSLLTRTKRFFNFIQHHFVFSVMIDCALAQLIAMDKIVSSEIFVFSRAIEDAVDTVLMRSRAESELARMLTEIGKLEELADLWKRTKESRLLLPCSLSSEGSANSAGITLQNLHYSRGTAVVNAKDVQIPPGVYALTGANGSGKSTLFRVLMSCETNSKPIELPASILMSAPPSCGIAMIENTSSDAADTCMGGEEDQDSTLSPSSDGRSVVETSVPVSLTMPSSDVVEISQTFYWPLHTKPIDWIYQKHLTSSRHDVEGMSRKVAKLLQDLEFRQAAPTTEGLTNTTAISVQENDVTQQSALNFIMEELTAEKEDWFNDLSGGQKSKVELVRKVFLHESCPSVLLIDETMAPLDPASKSMVMQKLKGFCHGSVVIVIYHTDVRDEENGGRECVPNNNFFDQNIHLENRTLNFRPVC